MYERYSRNDNDNDDDDDDNINQNEFHADRLNPFHSNLLCRFYCGYGSS